MPRRLLYIEAAVGVLGWTIAIATAAGSWVWCRSLWRIVRAAGTFRP